MNGKMFKKQKKSTAQRWSLMTVICMGLTSTIFVTASPESLAATDYPIYGEEQKIEIGREFEAESSVPKTLTQMQEIPGYIEVDGVVGLPMDIRKEALKEAALSYGARGGLAARSFEIRKELDTRADYLDKVFNFRQLLIAAPSGFMIEPPIISESLNALLIDGDGQSAAVSDAIYRIHENVKIVSSPRNWRTYLERGWGEVEEPPEILRPKNDEERMEWRNNVKIGWKKDILRPAKSLKKI